MELQMKREDVPAQRRKENKKKHPIHESAQEYKKGFRRNQIGSWETETVKVNRMDL